MVNCLPDEPRPPSGPVGVYALPLLDATPQRKHEQDFTSPGEVVKFMSGIRNAGTNLIMDTDAQDRLTKVLKQPVKLSEKYSGKRPELEWTDDQKNAIAKTDAFLKDPNARCMVFKGYAGTGKTTVVADCMERYLEAGRGRRVLFTAPHNEATNILDQCIHWLREANPGQVECMTTYKGHELVLSDEHGSCIRKQVYNRSAREYQDKIARTSEFNVLVVDECSMADAALMTWIYADALKHSYKVVFMGDPKQLAPIGEKMSQAFAPKKLKVHCEVELKEVVRMEADNQCMKLIMHLRDQLDLADADCPRAQELKAWAAAQGLLGKDSRLQFLPDYDSEKLMFRMARCPEFAADINHFRILCATNARKDQFNAKMRVWYLGRQSETQEYMDGEHVRLEAPYESWRTGELDTGARFKVLFATKSLTAHDFENPDGSHEELLFKTWHLYCEDVRGNRYWLQTLHGSEKKRYADLLKTKKWACIEAAKNNNRKGWRAFYALKKAFAHLSYGYASTVHAAQGASIEHVWVDAAYIQYNQFDETERKRILYVSGSRPKQTLTLSCPVE